MFCFLPPHFDTIKVIRSHMCSCAGRYGVSLSPKTPHVPSSHTNSCKCNSIYNSLAQIERWRTTKNERKKKVHISVVSLLGEWYEQWYLLKQTCVQLCSTTTTVLKRYCWFFDKIDKNECGIAWALGYHAHSIVYRLNLIRLNFFFVVCFDFEAFSKQQPEVNMPSVRHFCSLLLNQTG